MSQRVSQIAIAFVISMAVLVLLGWQFDIALLKSGFPGSVATMKANAAICCLLSGISLALLQKPRLPRRWHQVAQGLAWFVIAVGGLTLSQYLFRWNLGLDELLFPDKTPSAATLYPGRMGQNTAFNFVLIGTALLLLAQKTGRCIWLAQGLSGAAIFISLLALLGYLFGVSLLHTVAISTAALAPHTAITFIVLSLGILLTNPTQGLMQTLFNPLPGGVMARRLLPWVIGGPLVLTLKEKEVLLKEVYHRVKNNLQIIYSLLNLQSGYLKYASTREIFRDSQNRVKSMALVHEKLYQSKDLAKIDFKEYVQTLVTNLFRSYENQASRINLKLEVSSLFLDIDTSVPCGLIINELVSNPIKYTFPDERIGEVYMRTFLSKEHIIILSIGDNGIGIPEGFEWKTTESLGLQLVDTLVRQLRAKLELRRENGTEFQITFPVKTF